MKGTRGGEMAATADTHLRDVGEGERHWGEDYEPQTSKMVLMMMHLFSITALKKSVRWKMVGITVTGTMIIIIIA